MRRNARHDMQMWMTEKLPLFPQVPNERCGYLPTGRPTALGEKWMLGSQLCSLTGHTANLALLVHAGGQISAKW